MPSVADLIVARLKRAGVAAVFGVPGGGSNLDVIEAARRAGLPFVLTATESGGAIAAMAQAEITGRPGACLTTIGPGVTSVVNGVACARLDRAPLLVLTDSYPAAGGDRFVHQRVDHQALLAPVTKWSATLVPDNAGAVLDILDHAIACAMAPPYGPVQIECAPDVAAHEIRGSEDRIGSAAGIDGANLVNSQFRIAGSWEQARADIARARKPLVLAGVGARRPADVAAVRSLCERHALPAMVTYKAKGVVADTDPHFAGVFTNATIDQSMLEQSDLLIGVGFDPVELLPRPWRSAQPIVYCGAWPVDARHVPFVAQLLGDVATGLRHVEEVLGPSAWDLDAVKGAVAAQRAAAFAPSRSLSAHRVVELAATAAASMATPAASMAAVQKKPPARVCVDAGAHMLPATMLWPVNEPSGMLISNGLSTMGFALPAAIGAALLERDAPDKPIVALIGDGGLLMCAGELLTAAREQLQIVTIVFNDRSLSLIDVKQRQRQYASAGVTLGDVSWCSVAEGFGMRAHVAATDSELERALVEALAHRGPSLIDARIDPASYPDTLRAIRG
jgi:acetolactate synthase-1/2/3 large subunit